MMFSFFQLNSLRTIIYQNEKRVLIFENWEWMPVHYEFMLSEMIAENHDVNWTSFRIMMIIYAEAMNVLR